MDNIINNINDIINVSHKKIEAKYFNRKRLLTSQIIFKTIIDKIMFNYSDKMIASQLFFNNIIDVSSQAISKKRSSIDSEYYYELFNNLTSKMYNNKNQNIFLIDGSIMDVNNHLKDDGYKGHGKEESANGYLMTIYDYNNRVPFNINIYKKNSERVNFLNLLNKKHMPFGSLLIFDRGFYSEDLLIHLVNMKYQVMFRIKSSSLYAKQIKGSNGKKKIKINNNDFFIIKYTIKSTIYYILTNHKKPINVIMNAYHKRWDVEEFYKTLKLNFELTLSRSKKENNLKQELYCACIMLAIKEILYCSCDNFNKYKKPSNTESLKLIAQYILPYFCNILMVNKISINDIMNRIFKNLIKIEISNRSYKRTAQRTMHKWYYISRRKPLT